MDKRVAGMRTALALGLALGFAQPASADTLSDSIEQFLKDAQRQVDEAKIWKIELRPSLKESVIWTDNVFLEDDNEDPFRLVGVQRAAGGRVNRNPGALRFFERSLRDFKDTEVAGRVDDTIIRSNLHVDFVLPVNPDYSKLFKTDAIKLLGADVVQSEYIERNDLSNTSFSLSTDIFGMLPDLIPDIQGEWGDRVWLRVSDVYNQVEDPLDIPITDLRRLEIDSVSFTEFERNENTAKIDVGYRGNRIDWTGGFEHYILRLDDTELRQAEHTRRNWHTEVGMDLPFWPEKRGYLRYDLTHYRFTHRSGRLPASVNATRALNDADVQRAVAGINGYFLSRKITGKAEVGYQKWDPTGPSGTRFLNGLSNDTNNHENIVGVVEFAYKPWEERSTQIQGRYENGAVASAISNFNVQRKAVVSVIHELIPDRLRSDVSFAWTRNSISKGPKNDLFEAGFGVVYSPFEQMDLSLRYLWRKSISQHEIFIRSAFVRGARRFLYTSESDGDFDQNIVEIAATLHF